MNMTKSVNDIQGHMYQILIRYKESSSPSFNHCTYAKDKIDLKNLLFDYNANFGNTCSFKSILLPKKYWGESK